MSPLLLYLLSSYSFKETLLTWRKWGGRWERVWPVWLAASPTAPKGGQFLVTPGVSGGSRLGSPRAHSLNVSSPLPFINRLALGHLLHLSETQFLHL